MTIASLFLFVLLLTGAGAGTGVPAVRFTSDRLPAGWTVVREQPITPAQYAALEERFGVAFAGMHSQHLDVRGLSGQVNVIETATDAGAERLMETLVRARGPDFIRRRGRTVVEFAKMTAPTAHAVRHALGFVEDDPVTWRVTFRAACLDALDYMEANRVSNLCQAAARQEDGAAAAEIAALVADWRPGDSLRLRAPDLPFPATYEFVPAPQEPHPDGPALRYRFTDLPRAHGLPYVLVRATIQTADRFAPRPGPRGENLPAPRWDDDAGAVRDLAAHLIEGCTSERERLHAVFDHVARHIAFGGNVTGSRYGVERVLAQKYGHCWDKSDALIALCRAAGLRARQVAGWLPAMQGGHVWAEVHLEGEGWLEVDATCRWLGVSADYLPWFTTEDGEMPIVYLAWPVLERID